MNEIFTTTDGSHSLISDEFGVTYHSKHGAITETQTVFIDAGLLHKAKISREIAVLEIGFGTGLNALMTLAEAAKKKLKINYKTFEAYPVSVEQAATFNYNDLLNPEASSGQGADFQSEFEKMHTCPWGEQIDLHPNFSFEKFNQKFEVIESKNEFDVIYFDAFAPDSQPELWEAAMFQKMYDALKPGGVLTTYCAKGVVKRTLKAVGFSIEALPGPPKKREITRAVKS